MVRLVRTDIKIILICFVYIVHEYGLSLFVFLFFCSFVLMVIVVVLFNSQLQFTKNIKTCMHFYYYDIFILVLMEGGQALKKIQFLRHFSGYFMFFAPQKNVSEPEMLSKLPHIL